MPGVDGEVGIAAGEWDPVGLQHNPPKHQYLSFQLFPFSQNTKIIRCWD